MINIYTIGFSKKDARTFFSLLVKNNISKLIDIRLNNTSQLSGFANAKHLPYFLELHNINYDYKPEFAPTKDLLDGYKKNMIPWDEYEQIYPEILNQRNIIDKINIQDIDNSVFLCSEPTAEKCHRRLLSEYIKSYYPDLKIKHL